MTVLSLPERVTIREVGPRDGLQAEKPLPVGDRVRLIDALSATGVRKIEAVSFVSPRAVPAMADAERVWAGISRAPGVAYSALVPNRIGAEKASEAGVDALKAFLAASDDYNRKNVNRSVEESIADVAEVVEVGRAAGIPVEVAISAAFGDPYEGDVPPERVARVAARLVEVGCVGISLGDTTGMATPVRLVQVLDHLRERVPGVPLNLHLHDTRGTAMANALAGLQAGITDFDSSVGGMGGSPFAPGANGNVATEDLVYMLEDMGVATGVDLAAMIATAKLAEDLLGHALPGQIHVAGPRPGGE
ncbi:MAG TPA: hydroxymethylglutaryl-CoA lyase [Actinomycetota bacterium]|nr:hydroxymethylglutaryl-CoA lyase [Actinomycetota bacterium]